MYGHQFVKEMEIRSSGYFHLKESTLCPALHRLECDGLVEGTWEDSPTGPEPSVLSHHRRGRGKAPLDAARVGSFHPGRQPRGQACVGPGKGCAQVQMTSLALRYLADVARHLHQASTDKDEILTEIRDHIEDSARELMDEGLPSDAAIPFAYVRGSSYDYWMLIPQSIWSPR